MTSGDIAVWIEATVHFSEAVADDFDQGTVGHDGTFISRLSVVWRLIIP